MAIDPAAETARYIDGLGAAALEKSAAYTTTSHWMQLASLAVAALITWIFVRFKLLERISSRFAASNWSQRTFIICAAFFLLSAILSLPWSIYQEWSFPSSYGRTSQSLADFLTQDAIGVVLSTILGGAFFLGIYALIKKAGKRWWLWSGGFAAFALTIGLLLSPTLIEPIFNSYKPVPEGPVRTALLKMADEAKIPHDRIFMYDGSRQSNNFTANVSGVFGSARIAISDVALKSASLDEVKAVTGHEVGHYVEGHIWWSVLSVIGMAIIGFFLADRLFPVFARWFGSSAQIGDATGLPILLFIMAVFSLLAQPINNAINRMGEKSADNYSLRTVNLPDALSSALVKTAEYRYPRPGPLQEILFYTHPPVEWRVRNAMEWKAKTPANAVPAQAAK